MQCRHTAERVDGTGESMDVEKELAWLLSTRAVDRKRSFPTAGKCAFFRQAKMFILTK